YAPTPAPVPTAGQYVHNFTTDGTTSNFFNIQGNLSTITGTVSYNGLTLTQCLKIEISTNITFTQTTSTTLTLVFKSLDDTKIKVDRTSHTISGGIVTVSLSPGAHTITKDSVSNLYYMQLT